jgi:hypothetical protein
MTIEERLEILEMELKRTKSHNRYLLGAVLLFMGVGIIGAAPSSIKGKVIRASNIVLNDDRGTARAILAMKNNEPGLVLYDDKDKLRTMMVIDKTGPKMFMFDASGNPRVSMGVVNDEPRLALIDKTGKIKWQTP